MPGNSRKKGPLWTRSKAIVQCKLRTIRGMRWNSPSCRLPDDRDHTSVEGRTSTSKWTYRASWSSRILTYYAVRPESLTATVLSQRRRELRIVDVYQSNGAYAPLQDFDWAFRDSLKSQKCAFFEVMCGRTTTFVHDQNFTFGRDVECKFAGVRTPWKRILTP